MFINDPDPSTTTSLALYVAESDATGVIALYDELSDNGRFFGNSQFSPDGTRIAFEFCVGLDDHCRRATRVMDLDGGNPMTYDDPLQDVRFAAFGRPDADADGVTDGVDNCPGLPNGSRVAMERGSVDVWTTNYDGSQQVRVTNNNGPLDIDPRFDASGSHIVFASNRTGNNQEIHIMNADGSDVTQLTTLAGSDEQPAISPDGNQVVFVSLQNPHQYSLWTMDADGGNLIRIVDGTNFLRQNEDPVYSPDGARIAFTSRRGTSINNTNQDIYTAAVDGTDEHRLTTDSANDMQPAFSPDGGSIVFISAHDGSAQNGEIYTMRVDGSNLRRVTNTLFREIQPTFSPDGLHIVFSANSTGSLQLYAINRDGSGLRQITDTINNFNTNPTLAPQADIDSDGIGDACDLTNGLPTPIGSNVVVTSPEGSVSYLQVTTPGVTTFLPITLGPEEMPQGYSLCDTCGAFDITTTATIVPPITVCLAVPSGLPNETFQELRLLHGEVGQWVDRTTVHIDEPGVQRQVCGVVSSLSPFALATQMAEPDLVFSDGFDN
ncbi:MAG: thrombospondin type 3 repeat-containing protein [Dokdonella sp.]